MCSSRCLAQYLFFFFFFARTKQGQRKKDACVRIEKGWVVPAILVRVAAVAVAFGRGGLFCFGAYTTQRKKDFVQRHHHPPKHNSLGAADNTNVIAIKLINKPPPSPLFRRQARVPPFFTARETQQA